jgi:hypothetical protein
MYMKLHFFMWLPGLQYNPQDIVIIIIIIIIIINNS